MRVSFRLMALAAFVALVCLGCAGVGVLAVAGSAPNPKLDPVRALVLRVTLRLKRDTLQTAVGGDATPTRFTVRKEDANANTIGFNLAAQGLIRDAALFRDYVLFNGIDAKLQAGTYLLAKTQSIPEIAQALTNAGASMVKLTVIEGWRAEQIAAAIDASPSLSFSGADFMTLVRQPSEALATLVGLPAHTTLEGFLYPDTYQLALDATAADLVTAMLTKFNAGVTAQVRADAAKQGLSLSQAVTLASIVEREAVVEDERPLIAGVYLNRFKKPMRLDADPTIQYALGTTRTAGNWWPNLTVDDYQGVKSPYNTYLNIGLPPTPIANPRLSSILAAVHPQDTPFFYFRASCSGDGRHKFAVTLAEQQANSC